MTVRKSDDAVSPVIGVMLMLVVTIIIAAVVAAFATGMVGDTSGPAPNAKMDVEIYSAYENQYGTYPTMHVSHISGESLATKDLKFTFTWDCPGGSECTSNTPGHHSSTYQYEERPNEWGTNFNMGAGGSENLFGGVPGAYSTSGYKGDYIQPLYINYGMNKNPNGEFFGGDFVMERGMTLMAYDLHLKPGVQEGNPAMDILFNNGEILTTIPVAEDAYTCDCGLPLVYEADDRDMGWMYLPAGWYCSDMWGCPYGNGYQPNYWYDPPEEGSESAPAGLSPGIMTCLPQGTAIDVSIIHIPTNKAIYTEKVYVE